MVLSREPRNREALQHYAATALAGLYSGEPAASGFFVGGRTEALRRLQAFDVAHYAAAHNDVLNESSSKLSPYIRHGLLSPLEVCRSVVARAGARASAVFLMQLAWRAYWYAVYRRWGGAERRGAGEVSGSSEAAGAAWSARAYGLYCIDESLRRLRAKGFLPYAARLWLASYLLHFEKRDWREGYALFQEHLVDADAVVNSLSWRWVAGNLTNRPFLFTRGSVERQTAGEYCQRCAAYRCPFEGTTEAVAERARRFTGFAG
ncbi:MAG: FAD-binding domain-containing protein [Armatimonadota bacterium]|nr:FAD-binding domain-containing protein [Armatimonadota bacterium]